MKTLITIWNELKLIAVLIYIAAAGLYVRARRWMLALLAALFATACASTTTTRPFMVGNTSAVEVQCNVLWQCTEEAADSCLNGRYRVLSQGPNDLVFACVEQDNNSARFYERQR